MSETKPLLYDLCCRAGGATRGYQRAGFRVIGVDINRQPHYIGDGFYQMGAVQFMQGYLNGEYERAVAFAASPPCQAYSRQSGCNPGRVYPVLLEPIRNLLRMTGLPYVIENVVGAPLIDTIMLCGVMFGLHVYRHRLFESNTLILQPPHPLHPVRMPASGHGHNQGYISVAGKGGYAGDKPVANAAMDIDWMPWADLAQAVPPAYTEYVGGFLMRNWAVDHA